MKRQYSKPIVNKISFDYRAQILTASPPSECFGSVINVSTGTEVCGSGMVTYIGWNLENPGGI